MKTEGLGGQRALVAMNPPGRKGFTLIELLVVIAVIAILAALLLSALGRARVAADNTVCRSNLRQYAVALNCYVGDFKYYPPCFLNETNLNYGTAGDEITWDIRLEPYTKTKRVSWDSLWFSPNSPMPNSIEVCPSYARLGPCALPGCYGYNNTGFSTPQYGQLGLGGTGIPPAVPTPFPPWPADLNGAPASFIRLTRDADVLRPSDMLAFGDAPVQYSPGWKEVGGDMDMCSPWWMLDYELGYTTDDVSGLAELALIFEKRRHAWRWNVVFCDGHTEHHRTRELFDKTQDNVTKRWNRDNLPHAENVAPSQN